MTERHRNEESVKRYVCLVTLGLTLFLFGSSAFANDGDVPDSVRGMATVVGKDLDRHYLRGLGRIWQNDEEYANFWLGRYKEQHRKGRVLSRRIAPVVFLTCGTVAGVFLGRASYWATKEPTVYADDEDSSDGDSFNSALWATAAMFVGIAAVIAPTVMMIVGEFKATGAERKLELLRNGLKRKPPPSVFVAPAALKRGAGLSLNVRF